MVVGSNPVVIENGMVGQMHYLLYIVVLIQFLLFLTFLTFLFSVMFFFLWSHIFILSWYSSLVCSNFCSSSYWKECLESLTVQLTFIRLSTDVKWGDFVCFLKVKNSVHTRKWCERLLCYGTVLSESYMVIFFNIYAICYSRTWALLYSDDPQVQRQFASNNLSISKILLVIFVLHFPVDCSCQNCLHFCAIIIIVSL